MAFVVGDRRSIEEVEFVWILRAMAERALHDFGHVFEDYRALVAVGLFDRKRKR